MDTPFKLTPCGGSWLKSWTHQVTLMALILGSTACRKTSSDELRSQSGTSSFATLQDVDPQLAQTLLVSETPIEVGYNWGEFKPSSFSGRIVVEPWFTPEGQRRLAQSLYKGDFYQMAHTYQNQITPIYCAVASSVVVLNALRLGTKRIPSQCSIEVKRPECMSGGSLAYPIYSQLTYLNGRTDAIKDRRTIRLENITPENTTNRSAFDPGLTLGQARDILNLYGAVATVHLAGRSDPAGVEAFRADLKSAMSDPRTFMIANFKGVLFGGPTYEHFSPLAAYDQMSDSVLVLDVAAHKNPWYWVAVEDFYRSMGVEAGKEQQGPRGYLLVRDR